MKKYIFKIFIFAIIIVISDILWGAFFRYWFRNIQSGEIGKANYIAEQLDEDILIFGPSRAEFHYNPLIISDSLGMTCYNCGASGYGILAAFGRLSLIKEHHQPKIIIVEASRDFDVITSDNNKYLGLFKKDYERGKILELFNDIDSTQKFKMLSQMYRYNSNFTHNPITIIRPFHGKYKPDELNGFLPQKKSFDPMKINLAHMNSDGEIDSLKLKYVERFIDLAQGSQLFFVSSPIWYGMSPEHLAPIKEICKRRNIPFIDFSNDTKYVHNNTLFVDGKHLNDKGADEFTKDLVMTLRPKLKQQTTH